MLLCRQRNSSVRANSSILGKLRCPLELMSCLCFWFTRWDITLDCFYCWQLARSNATAPGPSLYTRLVTSTFRCFFHYVRGFLADAKEEGSLTETKAQSESSDPQPVQSQPTRGLRLPMRFPLKPFLPPASTDSPMKKHRSSSDCVCGRGFG